MSKMIVQMTEEELVMLVRKAVSMEMNYQKKKDSDKNHKELTRQEAAELLNVSIGTIDNWSKRGILKKYARGGRIYFIKDEILKSKKEIIYKILN